MSGSAVERQTPPPISFGLAGREAGRCTDKDFAVARGMCAWPAGDIVQVFLRTAATWILSSSHTSHLHFAGASVMWKEFKEFAIRGNALELAIGVIMATSFQPIVKSLVDDIIMPPIGMVAGQVDFKDKFIALDGKEWPTLEEARKKSAPVIGYGQLINTVINFFIIAFCVFLIVKAMNRLKKAEAAAPKEPTAEERLLAEIRDLLKAKA
jgi:large conductance mechanosensitive channel